MDNVTMLSFILQTKAGVTRDQIKATLGKGVLLKNVSQDITLSYGLLQDPDQSGSFQVTDVMAFCQDPDRLSVLFYTNL